MAENLPAARSPLPASLADVAEVLGLRVALVLMRDFGGRDLRFPVSPREDHPVVKALGMEDARALGAFLGGDQIYIPHNRRRRRSYLDDIAALEGKGKTRPEIAAALGLSERYVRMLVHGAPPPSLPLFPDED